MKKQNEKQKSFQYGAAILLMSTVIVKLIGALFKIPLANENCLGDLGFGYFSYSYDLFIPIHSLAIAGLPVAVSRITAECYQKGEYGKAKSALTISKKLYTKLGLIGMALIIVLVLPLSYFSYFDKNSTLSILAVAPAVLFCCIASAYKGYYEGLCNMYPHAISEVVEAFCKLFLGYSFAYFTVKITGNVFYGAAAAILGITIGTAFAVLYLKIYNRKAYKEIPQEVTNENILNTKILVAIALPIALTSFVSSFVSFADVFTVKPVLDKMLSQNGDIIKNLYAQSIPADLSVANGEITALLYGVRGKAFTIYNLIPSLTMVLGVGAVPTLAAAMTEGKKEIIRKRLNTALKMMTIITFPAAIGLIVAGPEIMALLYDSTASYQIGGPLLVVFGFAAFFSGIAIPLTSVLQSIGRQKTALLNILIGGAVKIAINLITVRIPNINILGAAIGTLCCYIVIFVLDFIAVTKHTGVLTDIKNVFLKPLFSALICGVAAFLILKIGNKDSITVLAILVAAVVYFAVLLILKTFEKEDFAMLPLADRLVNLFQKIKKRKKY